LFYRVYIHLYYGYLNSVLFSATLGSGHTPGFSPAGEHYALPFCLFWSVALEGLMQSASI